MPLGVACVPTLGAAVEGQKVTRCGWIQNPTPFNWYVTDSQGDWWLMSQGDINGDNDTTENINFINEEDAEELSAFVDKSGNPHGRVSYS